MKGKNKKALLELIRAGLWENEAHLSQFGKVDYKEIYRLAEGQSVLGLVAAGFEHVKDVKVPQEDALTFVGAALQLEQRNLAMNNYIEVLIMKLRQADIYTLLVKGQGVAQCYERPLWRSSGDVDLFLSDSNYEKAKIYLTPFASKVEKEFGQHFGMAIDSWVVELHGNLRTGLSSKIDRVIDEIRNDIFYGGNVRSWLNGNTQVFLPSINNDAILIFTHILKHFYKGGVGFRQICDWTRLLWTYRSELNRSLLEQRLIKMGLMSEWLAFGALAVNWLGLPDEAMPLYSSKLKYKKKGDQICEFVFGVGNFGHNRDSSYYGKYPYFIRKVYSFSRRCKDLALHARVFPIDSFRFFPKILINGLKSVIRGE